jgi:hypothetical protein
VLFGIALQRRRSVARRINGDGEKLHPRSQVATEALLEAGHLGGQERAGVDTGRIDKCKGDDPASERAE